MAKNGLHRTTDAEKNIIRQLADKGYSITQIHDLFPQAYREKMKKTLDRPAPSSMTIRRVVRQIPQEEPVVPWDGDWPAAPESIGVAFRLLEHLAILAAWAGLPKPIPLQKRVLRWALRLRKSVPEDATPQLLGLADCYATLEREKEFLHKPRMDAGALDGFLTFRPWESPEHAARYREVVDQGLLPDPFDIIARDNAAMKVADPEFGAWLEQESKEQREFMETAPEFKELRPQLQELVKRLIDRGLTLPQIALMLLLPHGGPTPTPPATPPAPAPCTSKPRGKGVTP